MSSTSQAPPPTSQQSTPNQNAENAAKRAQMVHRLAVGSVIIFPLIIALPPRKFDMYTMACIAGTLTAGNQLVKEYSGRSISAWIDEEFLAPPPPPVADEETLKKAREILSQKGFQYDTDSRGGMTERLKTGTSSTANSKILEHLSQREAEEVAKLEAMLGIDHSKPKKAAWKVERDRREKEAFEQGKGYSDLILDQIWEVWNWKKDKPDESKPGDEKPAETKDGKEEKSK